VLKRCTEFFKKVKESSYWVQLQAAANSVSNPAEFRKALEGLDSIDKDVQTQKH
jgi:hypothetical protein